MREIGAGIAGLRKTIRVRADLAASVTKSPKDKGGSGFEPAPALST
jgi:hypothetical protein